MDDGLKLLLDLENMVAYVCYICLFVVVIVVVEKSGGYIINTKNL